MIMIMRAEKAKIVVSNRKVGIIRERNALGLYDANKARDKTLVCGASSIS